MDLSLRHEIDKALSELQDKGYTEKEIEQAIVLYLNEYVRNKKCDKDKQYVEIFYGGKLPVGYERN